LGLQPGLEYEIGCCCYKNTGQKGENPTFPTNHAQDKEEEEYCDDNEAQLFKQDGIEEDGDQNENDLCKIDEMRGV